MDRDVMARSADRFNQHIKKQWGDKAKALLVCDNLDAHIYSNNKQIIGKDGRVFLCCLPPQVTEAIQPIDAGYGRSMRCAIGRILDQWLATEENMTKWEAGMTTAERRVLISNFVAAANKEVLENDEARVSCFRRCGILMTLEKSDQDDLIKPQGCTKLPLKIPDLVDLTQEEEFNNPQQVLTPEEWDSGITAEDEDIQEDNNEGELAEGELEAHDAVEEEEEAEKELVEEGY
jgi:hypothetical protein